MTDLTAQLISRKIVMRPGQATEWTFGLLGLCTLPMSGVFELRYVRPLTAEELSAQQKDAGNDEGSESWRHIYQRKLAAPADKDEPAS